MLKTPVIITVKDGKAVKFESENPAYILELDKIFKNINFTNAYYLAECGIGFNRNAKLCGNMLIDEGAYGCIHFGFGSNSTIGGQSKVNFHLDFVATKSTLVVDEQILIESGEVLL